MHYCRSKYISIHAPLAGRDEYQRQYYEANREFQSTRPLRGATAYQRPVETGRIISIHAPLAGRDASHIAFDGRNSHFNPRAPCGARHRAYSPPRSTAHFNPRAPCGARRSPSSGYLWDAAFQSTRPLRGATVPLPPQVQVLLISIHAPLAGRDPGTAHRSPMQTISIHAPLAGRDGIAIAGTLPEKTFQSTRPLRGATTPLPSPPSSLSISIHAPLAGRDLSIHGVPAQPIDFNPRAPCGARLLLYRRCYHCTIFQSTRPLRGATQSDAPGRSGGPNFNPRAPCGARRAVGPCRWPRIHFNPRAPCGARQRHWPRPSPIGCYFNPRAPCGARHQI